MIALIPARSGSKGVKDKNIKMLGGIPLIAHSINAAKKINNVDRIIVSTDSKKYAEIAQEYGAEAPFIRPPEYSNYTASYSDIFKHFLSWLDSNKLIIPKYLIHLRPTSPIRETKILNDAVDFFLKKADKATSLRSGHLASESPYKWFATDNEGYFKSFNDRMTPDDANMPRQTFPDVYVPNGYIDIIKSNTILSDGLLLGNKMLVFKTPICHEIDTIEDFKYLEYLFENLKTFK